MQDTSNNINFYYETFCSGSILKQDFRIEVDENEDTINILNKLNVTYTYEIIADESISETQRQIIVRLYIPGLMTTGRYVYSIKDAQNAHRMALKEALHFIPQIVWVNNKNVQKEEIQAPSPNPVPEKTYTQPPTPKAMTQDEILNIVQQAEPKIQEPDTPITTAEQLRNDERNEVPFDDIEMSQEELEKILTGNVQTKSTSFMNPPVTNIQQPVTTDTPKEFTPEQIQKIQEFKKTYQIDSDELFGKYVNSWNKKLSSKRDITPENIDEFLEYIGKLGKFQG